MAERRVATLPAVPTQCPASLIEAERKRSASDLGMAQHIPEPFASISAQQLVQENCRHCGMIRKESGRVKIWQDRYLILHKGCLYYYSSPEASSAQGQFSLSGYRVLRAPEKLKYQWTFKLAHYQPEKRTYHFAAHSEKEMDIWMDYIREDIAEYASYDKRDENIESTSENINTYVEDGEENELEYSYPDVEPLFTKEDFILKCSGPELNAAQSTDSKEHLYCPPPDFPDASTRSNHLQSPSNAQPVTLSPPQSRKPKPLPPTPVKSPRTDRKVATMPPTLQAKPRENLWQASLKHPPPAIPPQEGKATIPPTLQAKPRENLWQASSKHPHPAIPPQEGKATMAPTLQKKPRENLWQASSKHPPPAVPPRRTSKDKMVLATPAPPAAPVPKAKPRKQDVCVNAKQTTLPAASKNQKTDMSQLIKEMNKKIVFPNQAQEEELDETDESYLHVVPEEKKSTLERGFPEGMSFKSTQPEEQHQTDVLPLSAERLDLDKTAAIPLLQNRTGMYLIHSSQTAQSKQAISVCTRDKVRPYLIFYEKKLGYALDPKGPRFETTKELIRYYYDNSLPTCDCKLSQPHQG